MRKEHFRYLSADRKTQIHAVRWIPEGEIQAVLQISHGMVEFIERYEEFASYLAERGVLVTGNDHLGHGDSVRSRAEYGYFAKEKGNMVLLQDIHHLRRLTQKRYPQAPYFLLGHSMGSFLARQYLCLRGEGLAGAVIMGTGAKPRTLVKAGMAVCRAIASVRGWRHRSRLVDAMAFGGYNRRLKHPRTDRDWLTREESLVDAYIADERCQFLFTLNGYYNLFYSLYCLSLPEYVARMPKELPVLFVAGEEDPVGDYGAGVKQVAEEFRQIGVKQVECHLYPEDRHEILNELDRKTVYEDLYRWMEKRI